MTPPNVCPYVDNPVLGPPWKLGWDHEKDGLPFAPLPGWSVDQNSAYTHGRRNYQDHASEVKRRQGVVIIEQWAAQPVTPAPKAVEQVVDQTPPGCKHPTLIWSREPGTGRWHCAWCDEVAAAKAKAGGEEEAIALLRAGVPSEVPTVAAGIDYLADDRDDAARVACERASGDPAVRDLLLREFGTTEPELIAETIAEWRDGLVSTPEWAENAAESTSRLRLAASASRLAAALLDFDAEFDYDPVLEHRVIEALATVQVDALYVEASLGGVPVLSFRRDLVIGRKEDHRGKRAQQDLPIDPQATLIDSARASMTTDVLADLARAVAGGGSPLPFDFDPVQPEPDPTPDSAEETRTRSTDARL